ncbi:MAG: DUF2213 domain-containing protein [Rhabdochlamydiaceae bacterium]|nr:DUF2213 domain-containing protein [Rhabdochlamydiaceae bacterium]
MKLTDVARFDRGQVKGDAFITDEGYIKANAIVTRTGVFLYKNPDGTIRKELRHPDEVFKIDSLDSMKMIPVTNGHPQERLVSAENAKRLAIGYTGETITQDGEFVLSNLLITDLASVKDVTERNRRELSLGYTVDLIPEEGNYNDQPYNFRQTNIKYNHLSIVDNARAGSEARIALDSFDAEEILIEEANMAKRKVKIDDDEILMEDNVANQIEQLLARVANLEAEKSRLAEEKDKLSAELTSLKNGDVDLKEEEDEGEEKEEKEVGYMSKENPYATHETPVKAPNGERVPMKPQDKEKRENEKYNNMDAAFIRSLVRERVKLQKVAEGFLDSKTLARIDDMSDLEIKKEVIKARQKNANLDGKTAVYIQARFDALLEDMTPAPSQVIATPVEYRTKLDHQPADATAARQAMIDKMKNGFKPGGKIPCHN